MRPTFMCCLRVPGREIVVSRELAGAGNKKSATNAYMVLKDAFEAVEQRLRWIIALSGGAR